MSGLKKDHKAEDAGGFQTLTITSVLQPQELYSIDTLGFQPLGLQAENWLSPVIPRFLTHKDYKIINGC